jgi:C-terminal processing protease CtpA/Prc
LMRLIKKIGDGHTQFAYWGQTHHHFPLKLQMFDGDLHLVAIPPAYRHLLGMRLGRINKHPVDVVIDQLKPVLQSVENPYSEMQRLAETMKVAEMLHGTGIISEINNADFSFIDEAGHEHRISLKSHKADSSPKLTELRATLPSGFIKHKARLDGVELFLDKKKGIALINFDRYPHTGMTAFAEKLCGIFSDAAIRNVVIDLRRNGGGDFFVGLTLAWGLVLCDELDWHNGMYVLIGRATFSAAMSNAVQYRQILNATLVGEPTGANPVGYQDADTFTLPNSGWVVMHSKRLYRFQEISTEGVEPDIFIAPELESLKQGKDLQLEWIIKNIRAH